jgi:beta-glucosidase
MAAARTKICQKENDMFKWTPLFIVILIFACCVWDRKVQSVLRPFVPPVSFEEANSRAEALLNRMSTEEKIEILGGDNIFFIKGFEKYGIPRLYLSDATQGIHIRRNLGDPLEKSTAFPCPLALAATWNTELACKYARSIGEEARAGGVAVLLGPGMNMYRISQCGRNFEYFGEDPFLAARMIENYVTGVQSTGTMATLKHFVCNNTDFRRRRTNSIVDERTLHEIYMPAFKAGIDAGAMAVMTSYNLVNGEWAGESSYVIGKLLRKDLGFRGLVMTDWWSVYDPEKVIRSGQDLEMPGSDWDEAPMLRQLGATYIKENAGRLLEEGKICETDIHRMAGDIIRTCIAMGVYERAVRDSSYLKNYPAHIEAALETARESIVLLRNENTILPISPEKNILLCGDYLEVIPMGGGSAAVEGYDPVCMKDALIETFGDRITVLKKPSREQIGRADVVILSIGTDDSEGWDRPFNLPDSTDAKILKYAQLNRNLVVIVNSGSGVRMTPWYDKVSAILYAWYPGQIGNRALAEILSGRVNPSGRLPMTIERQFEDSPAYPYIPEGDAMYTDWETELDMTVPIIPVFYDEGVFMGYRWYESKHIEPLYAFGFGLSYTTFSYSDMKVSHGTLRSGKKLCAQIRIENTGQRQGYETVQCYVQDVQSSVPRPVKELKGFQKISLAPGEGRIIRFVLEEKDFSFYDEKQKEWIAEAGEFVIHFGAASNDIRASRSIELK